MENVKIKKTKHFRIVQRLSLFGFILSYSNPKKILRIHRISHKPTLLKILLVKEDKFKINYKVRLEGTSSMYWEGWQEKWVYDRVICESDTQIYAAHSSNYSDTKLG